jgi:hypothetical protein
MATLCRAYPSKAAARRGVEDLRAAGLPPQNFHLITGGRLHDLRREPAGEFATTVGPQAPVRTFANTSVPRWRPGGGFAGDPDLQREGSFADADSHVVIHRDPGGHEHTHVAGLRELGALLIDAGLAPDASARALAQLLEGSSLVLVQIAEMAPADAAVRLERVA